MLEISCAFATSLATPEHVVVAEQLGYRRAWLYDSPALYPDVWAIMALSAQKTRRIGLGPGVLIPSLRHPMTNAAAIAMMAALAPGRLEVAIGSGFTGRMTLGQKPLPWKFVRSYVETLKALLRGEATEWEGALIQMMHPEGFGAARPLEVPLILGVGGPKGVAAAIELADGVFAPGAPPAGLAPGKRCVILSFGTVLGADENPAAPRVMEAAGHAAGVRFHAMYEAGADVSGLHGGADWLKSIDAVPAERRHIALHEGHLISMNDRDRAVVSADTLRRSGLARTSDEWRDHLAALQSAGATEIAYQPAGPDIPGELRRFASAAGL